MGGIRVIDKVTFDRATWIDEASALCARLVNPRPAEFHQPGRRPPCPMDERLSWLRLSRVGIGVGSVRMEAWDSWRLWKSEYWLEATDIENMAMYFAWLKQQEEFSRGSMGEEFAQSRVLAALRRLIEWASDLPYDAASSPWRGQAA